MSRKRRPESSQIRAFVILGGEGTPPPSHFTVTVNHIEDIYGFYVVYL
jgi:hypothetical protein